MKNAQKTTAYIARNKGSVKIHLDNLTIELLVEDENPGPLGVEEGQEPGVIFWRSQYSKKHPSYFEHGKQKPISWNKIERREVETIIETLNKSNKEALK